MFNLINRQVEDLRPGSAVGEKGKKKKHFRQALAPIAKTLKPSRPTHHVPLQSIPKISTFVSFFTAYMFVHMYCLLPSTQPVPLLTTLEKLCNRLRVVVVKRLVVCLQLESWI